MGFLAITWAYQQDIESGAKSVLLALAYHADLQGFCFPSQKRLARMLGRDHTRSIRTHLAQLEELGVIRVIPRTRDDGSTTTNMYQLLAPAEVLDPIRRDGDDAPEKSLTRGTQSHPNDTSQPPTEEIRATHPWHSEPTKNRHTVNSQVNRQLNQELSAAAEAAAETPPKKRKAKPPVEEDETTRQARRVRMHILEQQPSLSPGQWVKINRLLPSLVQHFGPDDLIEWYDAKCASRFGAHADLEWANTDLPQWKAKKEGRYGGDAGRRRADPNQQIPSEDEFERLAKIYNPIAYAKLGLVYEPTGG